VARGDQLLDEASKLSVDRALEAYQFALQADKDHAAAHAGIARVLALRVSRRWEEDDATADRAVETARRATALAPEDSRTHAALSFALQVAEQRPASLEEADRAWALHKPGDPPWITETYASALTARGDSAAALEVLDQERLSSPERYQVHFLRGNALIEKGDLWEAVQSFRRTLLLQPDFSPAMLQIAYAYDRLEKGDSAGAYYADVIDRFPEERGRVMVRTAASLIARQRYGDALEALSKVEMKTSRGFGQGTVLYLRALCSEKSGRASEARDLYRRVIAEYPRATYGTASGENLAVVSSEALAGMELREGRNEEAVALMNRAMEMEKPTITLFLRLSELYASYRLDAEAAAVLERAAKEDFGPRQAGRKTSLYTAWARVVKKAGNAPGASPAILQALERDADGLRTRGDLGDFVEAARACLLAGDSAAALRWLSLAIERGYRHLDWIASDPEMAPLMDAAGFAALRRRAEGS
jgi:tetratricopeptide (TPR) repeat protein